MLREKASVNSYVTLVGYWGWMGSVGKPKAVRQVRLYCSRAALSSLPELYWCLAWTLFMFGLDFIHVWPELYSCLDGADAAPCIWPGGVFGIAGAKP